MKENNEKVIFACMEHVEQAIDDFVNFQEVAPLIIKLKEERKCTYCTKILGTIVIRWYFVTACSHFVAFEFLMSMLR